MAAFVGDIGLAEDLAQDALVDALRQWPRDGTPQNPGAWLTTVAKRKAVDRFRRNHTLQEKYAQLGHEFERAVSPPVEEEIDFDPVSEEEIADDRLRLMFVSCHPVLSVPAPDGAHLAPDRRLDGARDRPGLRGAGADHRAADRPRQEDDRRSGRPLRGPARRRAGVSAGVGAPGHLSDLQRGVRRDSRGGLAAARALRRSPPARPGALRPGSRGGGGLRPRRPPGVPVVAPARPYRTVGPARPALGPGPTDLGPPAHQPGRGGDGPGRNAR